MTAIVNAAEIRDIMETQVLPDFKARKAEYGIDVDRLSRDIAAALDAVIDGRTVVRAGDELTNPRVLADYKARLVGSIFKGVL
jgi:hypothetical protein